jgi:hypothetical protein
MPRRDAPATEFVNAEKPISVTLYNKVLHDYSGTPARSRLNIHVNTIDFALSHIQGPMANSAQQTWRQYLRRTAMYTCLCFQLANTDVIADASWKFSDMGWLKICCIRTTTLSVGAMMAMVGKNDDAQATSSSYFTPKRNLMSGLGGSIVEHPLVRKGKDELAGKFRYGKTILITDLMYKCSSNTGGDDEHPVRA